MKPLKILVIDDEAAIREVLERELTRLSHRVTVAADRASALEKLRDEEFQVILTDLVLPDVSGMSFIKELCGREQQELVIVMTGFPSLETVLEAMRLGAYHYVVKPFKIKEVAELIEKGTRELLIRKENQRLRDQINELEKQLKQIKE